MSERSASNIGRYLLGRIPAGSTGKVFFRDFVVGADEKSILEVAAKKDSLSYAYNGIVSFLGGLAGLHTNQAAWAVTKMYYSAFYIARASLCRNGHLVFHVPIVTKPGYSQYELFVRQGEKACIASTPSTHKLISSLFQKGNDPPFMQGLLIDELKPIDWLMEQREFWQYRSGRFPDPEFPAILSGLDIRKLQKFLGAYDVDNLGIYLSDPDHALVAIPFKLITWYLSLEPITGAGVLTPEDFDYLRKSCNAGKQNLTAISRLLDKQMHP